jgi:hypothetical protein
MPSTPSGRCFLILVNLTAFLWLRPHGFSLSVNQNEKRCVAGARLACTAPQFRLWQPRDFWELLRHSEVDTYVLGACSPIAVRFRDGESRVRSLRVAPPPLESAVSSYARTT